MAVRYFVRQALRSMRRSPVLQLISIGTIAFSMLILCAFVAATWNLERLADRWTGDLRLIAFLVDDADAAQLQSIANEIRQWPEVEKVETRTRAAALAEFRADLGEDDVRLAGIEASMMPATVEVTPGAGGLDDASLDALAQKVRVVPGIGEIGNLDDGRDLVERLLRLRQLVLLVASVLGGLITVFVVFIIANTVRLGLYARRDEVEVMQLVGATDHFVRGPYYIEGGLQGLVGASLAVGGIALVFQLGPIDSVLVLDLLQTQLSLPPATMWAALILGAGGVGVAASHFAVTRYLRTRPTA